jgi:hypothetical protein
MKKRSDSPPTSIQSSDDPTIGARPSFSRLARRAAGIAAILGGLANFVADYMIRGGPAPTSASAITLEALGTVPPEMAFAGGVLGAAAIPLWAFGLVPVYAALEPAGRRLALIPVILMGYGIAVGSGSHGAYALYAGGFRARDSVGSDAESILTSMVEQFVAFDQALVTIIVVPWMIGSIAFVAIVALRRTHYARWMALLSPILVPITMPVVASLPAPIGGYVRPIMGTSIWTLFFVVAVLVTWRLESDIEGRLAVGTSK